MSAKKSVICESEREREIERKMSEFIGVCEGEIEMWEKKRVRIAKFAQRLRRRRERDEGRGENKRQSLSHRATSSRNQQTVRPFVARCAKCGREWKECERESERKRARKEERKKERGDGDNG